MANNNNHDDAMECPLCMEPLEMDDVNFFPCTCGYQICRFCWHRIRTDENGLCPACRKPYPEHPADFKPLTEEELQKIKNEKKQKDIQRKQKISENRKHLASVRVVQKNLVFVVGLSQRLADPEILKKHEYFGKFGKILKVVINQSTSYAGSQGPSASAYVTYQRSEDALKAIQAVNNVFVDGRTLKASLGTTKYCSHFLKNAQCPKPDCMYLHELGDEAASFTKEDMQLGKHQEYERKLLDQLFGGGGTGSAQTTVSDGQAAPRQNTPRKGPSPPPVANTNKEAWPSLHRETKSTENCKQQPSPPLQNLPQQPIPQLSPTSLTDSREDISIISKGSPPSSNNTQLSSPREEHYIETNGVVTVNDTHILQQTAQAVDTQQRPTEQRRSPFDSLRTDDSSLFSNSFMPQPRPVIPPVNVPNATALPNPANDWQAESSLFGNDTLPITSSTNWQEAFGFSSLKDKQEDDLGFDPWDESSKGLAEIMEKELQLNSSPPTNSTTNSAPSSLADRTHPPPPGFNNHISAFNPAAAPRPPYRPDLVGSKMMSWMPHTQPSNSMHQPDPTNMNAKDWQDGLRALLPNINISFGQPNLSTNFTQAKDGWNSAGQSGWPSQDPAIITSITVASTPSASYTNTDTDRESNLSESPPHWMKSLHTLTEVDSPTHTNNFYPPHSAYNNRGANWLAPQVPPPGFNPAGVLNRPTGNPTEPQQTL
ncbi:CCR4-NOT transcription complex subunit 4-like [Ptychodera flava]|uniref:CCR4-NOT transcription complex subunit 4-like n=1 Tax=Ptychodera flava TaxID=63121 RepID=UPI00396A2FDB